jgi:hypothetical protein
MDENNKQVPANINLVRKTLLEEGCPVEVVAELCRYFAEHPKASVGQLNRHLDEIATGLGYQNYGAYMQAGFCPVQRDKILVSAIYSPA